MRKLISEILNSENVIEKCCELEILKRNWKLLLFDSGVDNLVLYEFNKKFGKYEICGMGTKRVHFGAPFLNPHRRSVW